MSGLQRSQSVSIHLDVRPLAGHIGAQIDNVRLARDLPDDAIAAIEAALAKYKVIFFRDQGHLDDAGQEGFAARFGELVAHPTNPARAGSAAILEIDSARGRADRWHTDVTFVDAYPKISVLRGVVIPPYGGDTLWANTVAAYDGLPAALKSLAENLWAVHSNLYDYAAAKPEASAAAAKYYDEFFISTVYETEHPVVRALPAGERSLVLGYFFRRFVGLSQSDSNHLFELFQSHITRPENTVRWRWNAGDVAMWDNTATQHCAINDYGDQKRVVRRSTIMGEAPVSVDGRRSVTKSKTAKPSAPAHHRQSAASSPILLRETASRFNQGGT
jgi:alpha-ketoglutarate-dependent taurine dioxygenase